MIRWRNLAMYACALALAAGAWVDARGVLAACLSAAVTLVALPLGCLVWRLLLPLIQGQWRVDLAPRLAVGLGSLPWALLGLWVLLPAAFWLYPWADQAAPGFRGAWLNPWSFSVRLIGYGLLWWWLSRRWGGPHGQSSFLPLLQWCTRVTPYRKRAEPPGIARESRSAPNRYPPRSEVSRPSSTGAPMSPALAALSLIVLVLSLSAAAIDWLLSLDKELASTLFGLLYVSRAGLLGLAWLGLGSPARSQPLIRGLLIAACLLWLYLHYMQYLAVWAGNLPREIGWYIERGEHGWAAWTWLLAIAQGVIPLGLLALPWGRHPRALRWASGLTLAGALLEISWLALPSLGLSPSPWLPLAWFSWAAWAWPKDTNALPDGRGRHGARTS